MKSRLSALKFIRNNKKQVYVMIIAIALTFMTMYVTGYILQTTTVSFERVFLEAPKKTAYVDLSMDTLGFDSSRYETEEEITKAREEARNEVIKKLKAHDGIGDVYYTQVLHSTYNAIMGGIGYEFPLLEKEEIQGYLDHVGAKLIEGEMPKNAGDILVDKYIANNQRVKIGDYFETNVYGESFKVCGIIESESMSLVGMPNGYTNNGWFFVIECDEENCDMAKVFADIGIEVTDFDKVYDALSWEDSYRKDVKDVIDAATLGIIIVITVFLAISIIVAYISFMRNRVNEYCLYASIGYGKKDIYAMIMRELSIIFTSSILIGFVIAIVVIIVFDSTLITPLGLVSKYVLPKLLLTIAAAFAAIIGIIQLPVIVIINNIKTMDLIEE